MMSFFAAYEPLFAHAGFEIIFALSQFIVLRAGVFSIATVGIVAIGAYTAAILNVSYGLPAPFAVLAALVAGVAVSLLLAFPLARLRGIHQAIATLAFVQIVISLALFFEGVTGGASGLNNIPKLVGTWSILASAVAIAALLAAVSYGSIGRAFDVVREDETLARSLGVSVERYQTLAFLIAGAIAGWGGGLYAFHSYSLVPTQFGFGMVVAVLAAVALGGRSSVLGPVVGATFLAFLPELGRIFANQRMLVHGALLVTMSIYMPNGIVEAVRSALASRYGGRSKPVQEVASR